MENKHTSPNENHSKRGLLNLSNSISQSDFFNAQYFKKKISKLSLNKPNKKISFKYNKVSKNKFVLTDEDSFFELIKFLDHYKALKNYNILEILYHRKGELLGQHLSLNSRKQINLKSLEIKDFNYNFNLVRKSKNKYFTSSGLKGITPSFVGTFLANALSTKKDNYIIIISRNDFLPPEKEEISSMNHFCELLLNQVNKLTSKAHALNQSQKTKIILNNFILPIEIINDEKQKIVFTNITTKTHHHHIRKIHNLNKENKIIIFDGLIKTNSSEIHHQERINLLGELLNTLRHEINNPLFGLKLTTDLLLGSKIDIDQKDTLNEIKNNIDRCQNIMGNFSNIYTNTNVIKEVDLYGAIYESKLLAKSEIRQIKFNSTIKKDEFILKTNPTSLIQVFFNLFINSAQAMKNYNQVSQLITITAENSDSSILIKISDNGPGIDQKIKEKIFQPFFTTKENGTGLGLAITNSLVKSLSGTISFYTNNDHSGVTFEIKLPKYI